MKSISRYLNEAKRQRSLATDAALSQELGVPPNHIFNWYNDVSHLNDEAAIKLARVLKIDPLELIACANYHKVAKSTKRRQNPQKNAAQRKFWRQVYNKAARKK
ncbi:MAG: helix-turn-helix domain-containing protein [Gammaproteobacteria bacterium]|nr:helix-turn-helix domain-containing protein [Gammaproteobacteria bacterium]